MADGDVGAPAYGQRQAQAGLEFGAHGGALQIADIDPVRHHAGRHLAGIKHALENRPLLAGHRQVVARGAVARQIDQRLARHQGGAGAAARCAWRVWVMNEWR